ncbi:dihydrofolate reductase [Erysipelothrix sp. HDW6C]|uniref:D-isomer specific 2-hydroxyacid dehydrogenase family protein n=1 Tax=Erysipelothrix sp. HDW6C TaxID=2714930 RepID=UPI001408F9E0|nr:D-isomer specific 2-hydroxyacid dehydrogenase family protein [Erysipelothrix sp. HDW6C]QIK69495.1 dihydrofolate reductase [Erysipelothrix sp. HDW6C]
MFKKIVAIEPVSLVPTAIEQLHHVAHEVVMYDDMPSSDQEIINRIANADAVLVSYTTTINKFVLESCPNIRYIGMCCSLYSPESVNVDIHAANALGITVKGVRDYGDEGVVEYVISELVRYLHGFGGKQWQDLPIEISGLNVGIVGLGTSGIMIADALKFMGANIHYFSRTRKYDQEGKGYTYLPFHQLLETVDVVFSCLNKNVILFDQKAFESLGNGKIFFNTSIGPSFEDAALENWLDTGDNEFFCDSEGAIGSLVNHPHVNCMGVSSGRTRQAFERLSKKVIENIDAYLFEH